MERRDWQGMIQVEIAPLQEHELEEAHRICNAAFGKFIGVSDPFGDRLLIASRWRAAANGLPSTEVLTARVEGRLIGSNVVTRWGSFGFFGPLTVLPEFWDQGVAKRLLDGTIEVFDRWGVRHSGLFTFPQSAKHVGLYQKYGYWPGYLTAIMRKAPDSAADALYPNTLFSKLDEAARERALLAAAELTDGISDGLDLSDETRHVFAQGLGDTVLVWGGGALDGFAVCHHGAESEAGLSACYVKFGAARGGPGAGTRFDLLLEACEAFAASRGVVIEAGTSLAREDAYRRMRARGYQTVTQGVAMQRPHAAGFNRAGAYVIDDWR